jgi:hypothetical protein
MKSNLLKAMKKKIKTTTVKCQYNNLQYDFEVPAEKKVTFKDVLNDFGANYFEVNKTFKNFEVFKDDQVNLNQNVHDFNLQDNLFTVFDFELNKKSFLTKTKGNMIHMFEFPQIYLYELYLYETKPLPLRLLPNVTNVLLKDIARNIYNKESNFFYYLLKKYKRHWVSDEYFNKINDTAFNIENVERTESNRIAITDTNSYKQFLIEILSPFVDYRNTTIENEKDKLSIDMDYFISGIDTDEYKCDLVIKNTNNKFLLPINIINTFDTKGLGINLNTKDKADRLFKESHIGKY